MIEWGFDADLLLFGMTAFLSALLGTGSHHEALPFAGVLAFAAVLRAFASALALATIAAHAFDLRLGGILVRCTRRLREEHHSNCGRKDCTGDFRLVHAFPPSSELNRIAKSIGT
jgi:hypothetical protein